MDIILSIVGDWKLHNCNRVHYFGVSRGYYSLCHFIYCVSRNPRGHLNGQCQHNHVNQKQPSASYPQVPFPLPFGLCTHWVLLISHTCHAHGLPQGRNLYPCCWLCRSALFYGHMWDGWVLLAGCHGLWLPCGHLLAPALRHPHVPQSLHSLSGGFLLRWVCECLDITGCLLSLSFCGPYEVNHFFCDYSPLLKLSCSHDFTSEIIPAILLAPSL